MPTFRTERQVTMPNAVAKAPRPRWRHCWTFSSAPAGAHSIESAAGTILHRRRFHRVETEEGSAKIVTEVLIAKAFDEAGDGVTHVVTSDHAPHSCMRRLATQSALVCRRLHEVAMPTGSLEPPPKAVAGAQAAHEAEAAALALAVLVRLTAHAGAAA